MYCIYSHSIQLDNGHKNLWAYRIYENNRFLKNNEAMVKYTTMSQWESIFLPICAALDYINKYSYRLFKHGYPKDVRIFTPHRAIKNMIDTNDFDQAQEFKKYYTHLVKSKSIEISIFPVPTMTNFWFCQALDYHIECINDVKKYIKSL